MSIVLTERQISIILALCSKTENNRALGEKAIAGELLLCDIESLCDLISGEIMMKGIEESFEPNNYGIELESLLDVINRPRIGG